MALGHEKAVQLKLNSKKVRDLCLGLFFFQPLETGSYRLFLFCFVMPPRITNPLSVFFNRIPVAGSLKEFVERNVQKVFVFVSQTAKSSSILSTVYLMFPPFSICCLNETGRKMTIPPSRLRRAAFLHKGGLNVQCLLFLSDVRKYKIGFCIVSFRISP